MSMDELDKDLDDAFEVEDENSSEMDQNNEEIEQTSQETEEIDEGEETLDDLLEDSGEKRPKSNDKSDKKIDNSEQNSKQQPNKSKRNNNSEDLVDNNGNIIAKAGAERRFYEENVRLKKERDHFNTNILPTLRRNYDAMYNKCNAYEQTLQSMQIGDLDTTEIQNGLELARSWKNNPEETIKFLLTQAKSYGMNIDTGTSVDTAAINQMLDDKLRPFMQERETAQREAQIKATSREIYDNFMNNYPDAAIHGQELSYLMKKYPDLSLDAVYYKLRNHYLEKGFDFNTPLVEILKKQQQNQQEYRNRNVNVGNVGVNQDIKTQNINSKMASVDKSFDYIIKEAMRGSKK